MIVRFIRSEIIIVNSPVFFSLPKPNPSLPQNPSLIDKAHHSH